MAVRAFYHYAPVVLMNWKPRQIVCNYFSFTQCRRIIIKIRAFRIADAAPVLKMKKVSHRASQHPNWLLV